MIAGTAKGTNLYSLTGKDTTRPTTDRAKQKLFDSLQNYILKPENVLDLFAGSGALGIEALSRGATHVEFVEKNRFAADIIRKNLEKTHLSQKSIIHVMDAFFYLTKLADSKFDLIFADPPYKSGFTKRLLWLIETNKLLNVNGFFVVEDASDQKIELSEALQLINTKVTGKTTHYIFQNTNE